VHYHVVQENNNKNDNGRNYLLVGQ